MKRIISQFSTLEICATRCHILQCGLGFRPCSFWKSKPEQGHYGLCFETKGTLQDSCEVVQQVYDGNECVPFLTCLGFSLSFSMFPGGRLDRLGLSDDDFVSKETSSNIRQGEDCSIRLWDIYAEDDSSDLQLGSHEGAAPLLPWKCFGSMPLEKTGISWNQVSWFGDDFGRCWCCGEDTSACNVHWFV